MSSRQTHLADISESGLSQEIVCQRLIRLAYDGSPNHALAANRRSLAEEVALPDILFLHNMGDLEWLSRLAEQHETN